MIVAQHNEPYGNFSIEPPRFAAQFRGKSIRDQFRVGADVDAVSRATITVSSAARAIRNSARRVAKAAARSPRSPVTGWRRPATQPRQISTTSIDPNHRSPHRLCLTSVFELRGTSAG